MSRAPDFCLDRTVRDIMVARRPERYAPTALARELAGRLSIGYDPDATYRFRLNVRAPLVPGAQGEAFVAGVWDCKARTDVVRRAFAVGDVKDGYAWYELPDWKPSDGQYLWVCAGGTDKASVSAVWISEIALDRR